MWNSFAKAWRRSCSHVKSEYNLGNLVFLSFPPLIRILRWCTCVCVQVAASCFGRDHSSDSAERGHGLLRVFFFYPICDTHGLSADEMTGYWRCLAITVGGSVCDRMVTVGKQWRKCTHRIKSRIHKWEKKLIGCQWGAADSYCRAVIWSLDVWRNHFFFI